MAGKPLFKDAIEMGAAYLFYLCQNHPFADGNKRVALACCLVFLSENNFSPNEKLDVDAWEKLVVDVASSQIDREEATRRVRKLLSKW